MDGWKPGTQLLLSGLALLLLGMGGLVVAIEDRHRSGERRRLIDGYHLGDGATVLGHDQNSPLRRHLVEQGTD